MKPPWKVSGVDLNLAGKEVVVRVAVEEGAAKAVCIDEKSVGRGHDYVTVVTKVTEAGPVLDFIGDGRDEHALDAFWAAQSPAGLERIGCVCMDMWQPYIKSVAAHFPGGIGAIVHDPFHIIQHMIKAVDEVRRGELRVLSDEDAKALKGTRQMWLYGFERLPEKWYERMRAFKDSMLKTARAWRLKETLRALYQWYRDATRSKLAPVKKVARMLKSHLDQVFCV